MDMNIIFETINPYVFLGCLMIGYLIKLWVALDWVDNKFIPTIVAIIGAVAYWYIHETFEQAIIGSFVGLMSTGGYELVRNIIAKVKESTTVK